MRGRMRTETLYDRIYRFRGVIFVISVPLALIMVVIFLMPRAVPVEYSSGPSEAFIRDNLPQTRLANDRWAVVIDCGSTGSRIHVYHFDENVGLIPIGDNLEIFVQKHMDRYDGRIWLEPLERDDLEIFVQLKPGLSSYADRPSEGADSLRELLDIARKNIPKELHHTTPVRVGATAGLRLLPGHQADELLAEVRKMLADYPFSVSHDAVSIIDGSDEGAFAWVTVNSLLGNLDKHVADTVGIVDLGGGSVQMAYAVEPVVLKMAPDGYIRQVKGKGQTWNVYIHSYLGYGLMAARAAVLAEAQDQRGHSCLVGGYQGDYSYAGKIFQALAREEGASYVECVKTSTSALKLKMPCNANNCSFNGAWSGGGGRGTTKLYIASYFYERAGQLSVIPDPDAASAQAKPSDFIATAKKVCSLSLERIASTFPLISEKDAPFACLDIAYQATLLTQGFGIEEDQTITLVKTIDYNGRKVEAAWPLGAAIDSLS